MLVGVSLYRETKGCLLPTRSSCNITADRKSTRLNSSHLVISYAVFCLKKKKITCSKHPTFQTSHSDASPPLQPIIVQYPPNTSSSASLAPPSRHVAVTYLPPSSATSI